MAEEKDPTRSPITWGMLALVGGMFVTMFGGAWTLATKIAALDIGLATFREEVREGFRRQDMRIDRLEQRLESRPR